MTRTARPAGWPAAVLGAGLALAAGCAGAAQDAALVSRGQQVFFDQGCHGCHNIGTVGSPQVAADLSRIGAKYSQAQLAQWLRDPASQKPTAHMPRIALSERDIRALAAYLATLR